MTGHASIFLVLGIIVASSLILTNIESSSSRIVENQNAAYLAQSAQNIAQTGVYMGLRQLANDGSWRTGFPLTPLLGGKVSVRAFDTTYNGRLAIGISATGIAAYHTAQEKRVTSTAFVAISPKPVHVNAAISTNAQTKTGGGLIVDGRDHTAAGTLIPGKGIFGLWTTSTYTQSGSSAIGGTSVAGVDYVPSPFPDTSILRVNQSPPGGFPTTPDSAMGGPANGYPEGTVKSVAQSGLSGSQYVTDPLLLVFPLSGVTYVELPSGSTWSPKLSGSGVVVIHNGTKDAQFKNPGGTFSGLIIADDVTSLAGLILTGAIIQITPNPKSVQIGTSNGSVTYSKEAIINATNNLGSTGYGSASSVVAWWE